MTKYRMIWLDGNGEPILSFHCYFKDNNPTSSNGEENTPFLDPDCTVSLVNVDITCTSEVFESRCEPAKH